jgi:hypothetical protein
MHAPASPGLVRDIAPGITALCAAIAFSLFFGRSQNTWEPAIVGGMLRFFRFTLVLCIPLCILFPVYSLIIDWKRRALLRVKQDEFAIQPLKHWLFRPFQGIGIAFLFRTKLLAMLQLIGGPAVPASLLFQGGLLDLRRSLLTSAVIAFASLLLSTLWTLDDMGIRYANRRDQELKMVGKYVGTLMPVVFGMYGVIGVMANYPTAEALLTLLRAVFVLYPPFVCFTVIHTYLIRSRKGFAAKRSMIEEGGVWCRGR